VNDGDLHPNQVALIAQGLGVTEQDVIDMNRRLGGDVSLNFQASEDGASTALQDRLVDDTPPQEQILVESQEAANGRKALEEALKLLNERERRIFVARRLAEEPSKLDELANKFGVSRERVRQIEARAFEKVRKAVKHRVAASATPEMIAAY
ncbi:MAG: polymerase sigma-32 factor, partial [Alphaproteobacteria bacterium]|nr:polymerase sigma-32 factor [Alphaproteobacteria bacterium]